MTPRDRLRQTLRGRAVGRRVAGERLPSGSTLPATPLLEKPSPWYPRESCVKLAARLKRLPCGPAFSLESP